MYLEHNNAGTGVLINLNGVWFYENCSPTGFYGDVDICSGHDSDIVKNLKKQLLMCDNEVEVDSYNEVAEYHFKTIEEIEELENKDVCSGDLTKWFLVSDEIENINIG